MKVQTLFNPNFIKTITEFTQEKIKISEAIALSKLIRTIEDEIKIYEKVRDKILKDFNVLSVENNIIKFEKETSDQVKSDFVKEINELLSTEFEITKVKLSEQTIDSLTLSTQELMLLTEIIVF